MFHWTDMLTCSPGVWAQAKRACISQSSCSGGLAAIAGHRSFRSSSLSWAHPDTPRLFEGGSTNENEVGSGAP
eukprot:5845459-Pyramimonas_sp.AAC.1